MRLVLIVLTNLEALSFQPSVFNVAYVHVSSAQHELSMLTANSCCMGTQHNRRLKVAPSAQGCAPALESRAQTPDRVSRPRLEHLHSDSAEQEAQQRTRPS